MINNTSPGRPTTSVQSSSVVRRITPDSSEPRATGTSSPAPSRASVATGKSVLERAGDSAKSTPDVDLARVNEVKTAIARGEFNIDPKAVARAFINMESA